MPQKTSEQLTAVQRRRMEKAAQIASVSPEQITYQHTILCQTCLPYRDPGDGVREWERKQGSVSLSLEAGKARDPRSKEFVKLGLPYGSRPRLVMAHLNATAIKTGSPSIEVGDSLTAFVRRLLEYRRSTPDGREIKRFKEQLSRLAAATVRMALDVSDDRAFQINTQIIDAMELWLGKDERQHVLWPSVVELSPRYFESLQKHAVPLDERAIGALANSSLALDIYAWLAQRLHRIPTGKGQLVTWAALKEQFGENYGRMDNFRRVFLATLKQVWTQYRCARIDIDECGLTLWNSSPPVHAKAHRFPLLSGTEPGPRILG